MHRQLLVRFASFEMHCKSWLQLSKVDCREVNHVLDSLGSPWLYNLLEAAHGISHAAPQKWSVRTLISVSTVPAWVLHTVTTRFLRKRPIGPRPSTCSQIKVIRNMIQQDQNCSSMHTY